MNEARNDERETIEDSADHASGGGEPDATRAEDAAGANEPGDGDAAAPGPGDPSADDVSELREQVETYKKHWQRAAADLQNYKRRTEQERAEQANLHKATLIINVLPIFDDLDRAVESVDARLAGLSWVQGVVNIHRKFAQLLESMEVRPVDPQGEPFDPNQHEAVGQQPGPENTVVAVLQKGYTLGDRVLRPAMVIVGDGSEPGSDGSQAGNGGDTAPGTDDQS